MSPSAIFSHANRPLIDDISIACGSIDRWGMSVDVVWNMDGRNGRGVVSPVDTIRLNGSLPLNCSFLIMMKCADNKTRQANLKYYKDKS